MTLIFNLIKLLLLGFFPDRDYQDTEYLGKSYRDKGYLGGKLKVYGIFKKKDHGISKIEVLTF